MNRDYIIQMLVAGGISDSFLELITHSPIIMEVQQLLSGTKETHLGGTHFPLPWEEEYPEIRNSEPSTGIVQCEYDIFTCNKKNSSLTARNNFWRRRLHLYGSIVGNWDHIPKS